MLRCHQSNWDSYHPWVRIKLWGSSKKAGWGRGKDSEYWGLEDRCAFQDQTVS